MSILDFLSKKNPDAKPEKAFDESLIMLTSKNRLNDNFKGRSLLFWAIEALNPQAVKKIKVGGADMNVTNDKGQSLRDFLNAIPDITSDGTGKAKKEEIGKLL